MMKLSFLSIIMPERFFSVSCMYYLPAWFDYINDWPERYFSTLLYYCYLIREWNKYQCRTLIYTMKQRGLFLRADQRTLQRIHIVDTCSEIRFSETKCTSSPNPSRIVSKTHRCTEFTTESKQIQQYLSKADWLLTQSRFYSERFYHRLDSVKIFSFILQRNSL